MHWPYISQNGGIRPGITNGRIEFGVNIYHSEVNSATNNKTDNFFNVGIDGGNSFYDGVKTKNLVSKIYPGQQWRWKEDPSGEIYTIQPTSSMYLRLLRYDDDRTPYMVEGGSSSSGTGTYTDFGITSNNPANIATYDRKQFDAIGQLSPNFSKNWRPTFKNEDGGTTMNWDPTNGGNTGPIPNGLHLSINASSPLSTHSGGFTVAQNYVIVDSLETTDTNTGVKHSISPGMIMTSHSNADTHGDWTTQDPGDEFLIISKIEEITSTQFHVYLTGYTKILTATTNATLDVTRHSILDDTPVAGQAMVFRQAAMNGYSQYSVNRINQEDPTDDLWSMGNPGILAVGYTIEFVEQIFKEPEMPNNPAIWETEPKESADLAIYYEASGLNPLMLDEENKNIAIPYGSTVQHVENPASIGVFDTVTSVGNNPTGWYIVITAKDPGLEPLVGPPYITAGDRLKITRPDGSVISVKVITWHPAVNNRTCLLYTSPSPRDS